jgi:predicted dehydrogenase
MVRATAMARSGDVHLAAICDINEERARAVAPGAVVLASGDALINASDIDAVVISTPPPTHEPLALAALNAGKHVLVEKPMAASAEACQRMIEAARTAGRILAVGFNHRYFKATKLVRDFVRSGALGRLTHVRAYAGHMGLAEFKAPWMHDRQIMGGGALMDNGIHVLDLVRYVMGDLQQAFGYESSAVWKLQAEDNALALFRAADGTVASLQASWTEWKGYRFHIEAYGELGMARAYYAPMAAMLITMSEPGGRPRVSRFFYPVDIIREKLMGWQSTVVATFCEEFGDFAALARGESGSGRLATGIDGLRAVEAAHAVYESGRTGKAVILPPFD